MTRTRSLMHSPSKLTVCGPFFFSDFSFFSTFGLSALPKNFSKSANALPFSIDFTRSSSVPISAHTCNNRKSV